MRAERGGIGEIEVELQQVPQPHRLTPERFQPISVSASRVGKGQFDDRRLEEHVDERVAVERRLMLILRGDAPDRLSAAVDTCDGVTVRQRVERGADPVGRP